MIPQTKRSDTTQPLAAYSSRRNCPACGLSQARPLGTKRDFELLRCQACATLYVSLLPTSESRMHYETGGYYSDENLVVPEFVVTRLDEIVATFDPYRRTNRLLDIGCGAGSLLMAARKAGWDAEGVELSLPTAEHLGKKGLKVFPGDLLE